MLFSGLLDAGIVLLLAAVFAEYLGLRKKSKAWLWIVVAGAFLIFAGLPLDWAAYYGVDLTVVSQVFEAVGWIIALIGVLYVAYEVFLAK
ncbi:MAG: hypothetical protein B6U78_01860 [Candidatus Aenigmarchaeota archaeon ex4484_224]|nr:MAG: hypothetical protein B6U78_01860 [Candidatus Aenigmarchaeota archaeon ex4484_224]